MSFIDRIFSVIWDISDFFLYLSYDARGIPLVGDFISDWFYIISRTFWDLLTPIAHFGDWVNDIQSKIESVISLDAVWSHFRWWFDAAEIAYNWLLRWQDTILNFINLWWSSASLTVQGWIDIATQGFNDLQVAWSNFWAITWPEWTGKLDSLRSEWNYFWTVAYPTLVSFTWLSTWWTGALTEVQGLINSAFIVREDFWAGWQDWRDKVTEFFTDPEDWLYKSVDRIIERFW